VTLGVTVEERAPVPRFHRQLSTVNRQLSTVNCQPLLVNRFTETANRADSCERAEEHEGGGPPVELPPAAEIERGGDQAKDEGRCQSRGQLGEPAGFPAGPDDPTDGESNETAKEPERDSHGV
jgi:hypothetical protein